MHREDMKVNLVYSRIANHAAASGYAQIERFLRELIPVERLPCAADPVPLLRPLRKRLLARAGLDWYNEHSLSLEIATAGKLLLGSNEIYHILYGEDTYRYLSALAPLVRRKKSKIVVTYHQPPSVLEKIVHRKQLFQKVDAAIALCAGQADYLASLLGDPSKVFLVRHAVDTAFFYPARLHASDRIYCLCVGQWLRDYDTLAEVARRLARSHPRVCFLVLTTPEQGAPVRGLENLLVVSRVSDAELLRLYHQSDIFVLPLIDATANNALLEGLACGLPVVATDVGGTRDYVTPGCAITVPPRDAAAMADAIARLAEDAQLREEMGAQSRARALELDWKLAAQHLTDVYRAIAN